MPKKVYILLILLFTSIFSFAQKIKEKNITCFRVYNYESYPKGKEYLDFTDEDISKMTYYQIPKDSLKGKFGNPHKLLIQPFLKGGSVFATVDLKKGKRKKIKLMPFYAIYKDLDSQKFYEITENKRDKFKKLLRQHPN